MEKIKDFKVSEIDICDVLFAFTSESGFEGEKLLLVYDNESRGYIIVDGWHCSCSGFTDTQFEAIKYTQEELVKLAKGWLKSGDTHEKLMAPMILEYLEEL